MRIFVPAAIAALLSSGCRGPETSIHVTETRELTYHDQYYPGDLKDRPPLDWRRLPGTQFRVLNYVAGENEEVEIVLGETSGGVLENANRWLGQFGVSPATSLSTFETTPFLEGDAVVVEASGTYRPGMGRGEQENYALIGVILDRGQSQVTLKMTGPAQQVEAQRDAFFKYMASFEKVDEHFIPAENQKKDEDFDE